jgi:hypothetical protein
MFRKSTESWEHLIDYRNRNSLEAKHVRLDTMRVPIYIQTETNKYRIRDEMRGRGPWGLASSIDQIYSGNLLHDVFY